MSKRAREAKPAAGPVKKRPRVTYEGELPLANIRPMIVDRKSKHIFYLVLAMRNFGKSVISRYIIDERVNAGLSQYVICFSGSQRFNDDWNCLHPDNRVQGFDVARLREIIQRAEDEKEEELRTGKKAPGYTLIFDDMIGQLKDINGKHVSHSDELEYLAASGRHINITMIVIVQYGKKITGPVIRQNFDVCILGENNNESLDQVYSCVNGFSGSKRDFREFVYDNTDNNSFLWFDHSREAAHFGKWNRVELTPAQFAHSQNFKMYKPSDIVDAAGEKRKRE